MELSDFFTRTGPLLCVFAASFLQSATGFGLVMIAAPLLMYFYDPKLVILIVVMLATCGNAAQAVILHKDARMDVVKWLVAGSIIGQPFGFFIYNHIPGIWLKLVVSSFILLSLTLMKLLRVKFKIVPKNTMTAGVIAGITTTTTGMGGPTLILYFSGAGFTPQILRATSITYFLCGNVCSMATFFAGGAALSAATGELIFLLPALVLGIIAGQLLFKYIPAPLFNRALYIVLIVTCLQTVWSVLPEIMSA